MHLGKEQVRYPMIREGISQELAVLVCYRMITGRDIQSW